MCKNVQVLETLLREMCHRWKSSFATIDSIMMVSQSKNTTSDDYRVLQNRIHAHISAESICIPIWGDIDNNRVSGSTLCRHIQALSNHLSNSYEQVKERVRINVRVDGETQLRGLTCNAFKSCTLIINELVTNALQYAFPEGRNGEICVALRFQNEQYCLTISDDGVGLPEHVDLVESGTTGIRWVAGLTRSPLRGVIEIDRSNGTTFKLSFPVDNIFAG